MLRNLSFKPETKYLEVQEVQTVDATAIDQKLATNEAGLGIRLGTGGAWQED